MCPAPDPQDPVDLDADEALQLQMYHARSQGDAFGLAGEHMAAGIGHATQEQRAGEYWVAYYLAPGQGIYEWGQPDLAGAEAELVWREPEEDAAHIAITVRDAGDGRFIPVSRVTVTLVAEDGAELGVHEHPLHWDPLLYHYGRNWNIPDEGPYSLRVRVDPPAFARHDQITGKRLREPVQVEFHNVKLTPRPS